MIALKLQAVSHNTTHLIITDSTLFNVYVCFKFCMHLVTLELIV